MENAVSIFETAAAAPRDGASRDLAILIDAACGMRIVDGAGWSPEGLQAHYGARTIYQVSRTAGGIQVSGRGEGHTCVLRSEPPAMPQASVPVRPWTMPHQLLLA
jgi:hypothetical protein